MQELLAEAANVPEEGSNQEDAVDKQAGSEEAAQQLVQARLWAEFSSATEAAGIRWQDPSAAAGQDEYGRPLNPDDPLPSDFWATVQAANEAREKAAKGWPGPAEDYGPLEFA